MVDQLPLERVTHAGGELVGGGHLFDDAAYGGLVPAALAQLVHAAAQVSRFAPDGEHIRGAAVLHFVNLVGALVYLDL